MASGCTEDSSLSEFPFAKCVYWDLCKDRTFQRIADIDGDKDTYPPKSEVPEIGRIGHHESEIPLELR